MADPDSPGGAVQTGNASQAPPVSLCSVRRFAQTTRLPRVQTAKNSVFFMAVISFS